MALFSLVPMFATFTLWFICVGALHPIRQKHEGMSYNNSYSSLIGDTALVLLIGMALQGLHDNPWAEFETFDGVMPVSILIAVIFVVYFMTIESRKSGTFIGKSGEAYHTLIIVPILAFLVSESFFVFVALGNETDYVIPYWVWGIALFAVWVGTFVYDARTGRLDQQAWLKKAAPEWIMRNMRPQEVGAAFPPAYRNWPPKPK